MNQRFQQFRSITGRFTAGTLALLFLLFAPAPILVPTASAADDQPVCNPVVASPSGVMRPNGADASTYTYNECTGLWENPHYTWNPATKIETPKVPLIYTYNQTTGKWDSSEWHYSPTKNNWYQSSFSVDQPPVGAQTVGGPAPVTPTPATTSPATGTSTEISDTNKNDSTAASSTTATMANNIGSLATTGDVNTSKNTTVGGSTSGNAQAVANVINTLNSSSGFGSNVATFTTNIDGDVQGDLIIDPSVLQPAAGTASVNDVNNVKVNVDNNGQINNNIALAAQSGDVNVSENTKAGDATSGNATAIANVVNMMNAYVTANQSFMGIININGNLQGNILMPQNFLDTLIASNAPHDTVSISQDVMNRVNTTIANNQSINNTINSSAKSGNVTASENTKVGNTSSGAATTDVTVFNLTGSTIVARNTMLVFVNVQGKWIGVIMNAPAGTTSAAYGGNVTTNVTNNVNTNVNNNFGINNDISVAAASGNVSATRNTQVGNVNSGSARTAVNIANITNSSLSNTGWFGLLFINVFGNWTGNFGVIPPAITHPAGVVPSSSQTYVPAPMFSFVAHDASPTNRTTGHRQFNTGSSVNSNTRASDDSIAQTVNAVLGKTVAKKVASAQQHPDTVKQDEHQAAIIGGILFASGVAYLALDYYRTRNKANS